MFKKTSRSALSGINHEAIAPCFRSDKARSASFFNGLKNKPINTVIREEGLKINVFEAEEIGGEK